MYRYKCYNKFQCMSLGNYQNKNQNIHLSILQYRIPCHMNLHRSPYKQMSN